MRGTSLFAATLPLLLLSRFFRRGDTFDPASELSVPPVVNTALAFLVSIERLLIRIGASFPFGSSLVVVGRRPIAA